MITENVGESKANVLLRKKRKRKPEKQREKPGQRIQFSDRNHA